MHLLSRDHVDTDELLNDIVNFERLDTSRTARIRSSNVVKEPVKATSSVRLETRQNTNSSTTFVSGATKNCFNCGSKFHIAPTCPKPRIQKGACYQCGSTTHQRSKCPVLNRNTLAETVEAPSSKGVNENESRIMNVTSNRTKASRPPRTVRSDLFMPCSSRRGHTVRNYLCGDHRHRQSYQFGKA